MNFSKSKYLIALGYSLFGSLDLWCFMNWIVMASFHDRHQYPYLYPFSILIGCLCLIICIALFLLNVYFFKSIKTIWVHIFKEALVIIISFIPSLLMWNIILEYIGQLF